MVVLPRFLFEASLGLSWLDMVDVMKVRRVVLLCFLCVCVFVRVFCDKRSRSGGERTVSVTRTMMISLYVVEVDVEDGVDVDNSLSPFWLQLALAPRSLPHIPIPHQRQRHEGSSGRIQITLLCRHVIPLGPLPVLPGLGSTFRASCWL